MRPAAAALFLLFAVPAAGQDEGLGLADSRGNFYSITNRRSANCFFQVTKLSLQGALQWSVGFDPRVDARASAAAVDREGNLLVAGTIAGPRGKLLLVAKYTPFGAFMWKAEHDAGGSPLPSAMAVDAEGHVYVAASVAEPTGSFLRVARFGPLGAYFWAQNFRGGRTTYARAVTIDPNGDARVTTESALDDRQRGYVQTRQVVFTAYGAVVPQ